MRFKTQATRAEREAHGQGLGPAQGHGHGLGPTQGQGLGPAQGHGLGPAQGQGQGQGLGDDSMMNVDDFYDVAMAAAAAIDANNNNNSSSSSSGGTGQPATNPTSQNNTNAPLQPQSSQSQSKPSQPSQRPLSQSSHWLSGPSSATHTPIPPIITDHFSCPPSASGSRNRLLHQWEQRRELMATNERIHLMEVSLPCPLLSTPYDTPALTTHHMSLLPSFPTYLLLLPLSQTHTLCLSSC